jgi:glucosylceramidase
VRGLAAPVIVASLLAAACGNSKPVGESDAGTDAPVLDAAADAEVARPPQAALTVSSAAGDRLTARPAPPFATDDGRPAAGPVVVVDESVVHQRIDGFGASFLEAGMVCLNSLPDADARAQVLRALFDPVNGAGFSMMKTVIGATDFQSATQDWYTYDDVPGDTELAHFSIARDLGPAGLVTYIEAARAAGGDFRLQAPMDYPPDWMMADASDYEHGQFVPPERYDLLARYYLAYVRAYEAQGITIDFLTPFNEPTQLYAKQSFESIWDIVRDHVGPLFEREGVTTRLAPGEAGWRARAAETLPGLLDDPAARRYVGAVTYHGYEGFFAGDVPQHFEAIAGLHAKYPDVPLFMTEMCCQWELPDLDFASGARWARIIMGDLEAGASAWIYWNMILDEKGGPWLVSLNHGDFDPNAQNALVQIDRTTHEVTYSGLYWFLAHFSKFARPGGHRIDARLTGLPDGVDVRALAFQNPDGTLVLEALNASPRGTSLRVRWNDRALDLDLPATSMSTLAWQ